MMAHTDAEKYGHVSMTADELEARVAADLYELSRRFQHTSAEPIGNLLWKLLLQVREAFRTAKLVLGDTPTTRRTV